MNRFRYFPVVAMVLVGVALLSACAGTAAFEKDASYAAPATAFEGRATERDAGAASAPAPAPMATQSTTGNASPGADLPMDDGTSATLPPEQPRERLRVYSADLDLSVAGLENARDTVITIAQDSGGYVESSQGNFVVIRVPAASFDRVLAEIEGIGTVRSRSVRTADVTDQFFDLERRLEIAETSRGRLNQLLERTEDADERVAILREIRRLTEEIERLRASFESLAQLIAYSRISIRLTPRIAEVPANRGSIPFPWIANLAPLWQTTSPATKRIPVTIPESFAVFSKDFFVMAEAADGTTIRIGAVANDPVGDDQFWARALEFHLGPFYQNATKIELGMFRGVILESKDRDPYHYAVAVAVLGNQVIVAETFYPNATSVENRSEEIANMLKEVEL